MTNGCSGALPRQILLVTTLLILGCSAQHECDTPEVASQPSRGVVDSLLADTEWRLVQIESMDDAAGTVRPGGRTQYTMRLNRDGSVVLVLDCNRANGGWKAEAASDRVSGRFEFGPLAATSAICAPPSLAERVTVQLPYVRGFLLKDGRLHLSLMADGGILVWEPADAEVGYQAVPDPSLEAAIRDHTPAYTGAAVDAGGGVRARYVYNRVDLNGDGKDEVLVYLLGPFFCGTGGCTFMVFQYAGGQYRLVNDFPITRPPVVVAPLAARGWHDLIRLESGGGAPAMFVRHVFDGARYVERDRQPAGAMPPEGRRYLAGDLTFQAGVPLAPRP